MSRVNSLNGLVNLAENLLTDRQVPGGDTVEPFAAVVGSGIAADGRVTVSVNGGGYVTDLVIDDDWLDTVDAQTLADAVKRAVADAVDQVHTSIADVLRPTADVDGWSNAVRSTFDELATAVASVGGYR